MPNVQMQIVRRLRDGEGVVYAEDHDFPGNAEYEHRRREFERHCDDNEYVRTIGDGSPFRVSLIQETEEEP